MPLVTLSDSMSNVVQPRPLRLDRILYLPIVIMAGLEELPLLSLRLYLEASKLTTKAYLTIQEVTAGILTAIMPTNFSVSNGLAIDNT